MTQLTQDQIKVLKNKGLTDEKIVALAQSKGFEMPKTGFWKGLGQSLIKSETAFGDSISGALGNVLPGSLTGRKAVDDANQISNDVTTKLLKRIKEKRDNGEDVSNLMNALGTMQNDLNFFDILNESTGGSLDKTAKQIFGEGFGVGVDILSAGTYSKAGLLGKAKLTSGFTRAVPTAVSGLTGAKTFWQGAKAGAKVGATSGSIIGASQGLTGGMQDNKTNKQILGQTIGGGLAGGLSGGFVGGVVGGVSGSLAGRAERTAQKLDDFTTDLVSPKQTADIKAQALRDGRVTESGLLSGSKITPSKRDLQLAEVVKDVVSPTRSPAQNITAIDKRVSEINAGVKAYVKANKVPFNSTQLKTQLNKGAEELKLVFASDKNAKKTYQAVVDEFVKHVQTKDTSGLLDARQAFDKIPAIRKLLETQGLGENTKREVVLTARDMANKYIANLLPKGNKYRATILNESKMIEVLTNIAEKEAGNLGKSNITKIFTKYPILKYLITGVAGGAATGVGISLAD